MWMLTFNICITVLITTEVIYKGLVDCYAKTKGKLEQEN